ncbi:unnamed protein product [Ambrosiozyma monospora]|uniref:Unnamed protein product n=1 Tax=Ambrosiozyma monospora TaxID=43982 RepID=A0ACB5U2V0_AMBMO|nr:unnamed protein product [Ambrosiozyma monospora]
MKRQKADNAANSHKFKTMEESETKITNEITRLTTARDLKIRTQKEETEKVDVLKQKLQKLESRLGNQDGAFKQLEEEYTLLKSQLETDKEAFQRKEDLVSTLSTGLSSKGSTGSGYMDQLNSVKKQITDENLSIEKNQLRINHLKKELSSNQAQLRGNLKEVESIKSEIVKKKKAYEVINAKLLSSGFDADKYNELKQYQRELQAQYQHANSELQSFLRSNPNFEFKYDPTAIRNSVDAVKGFAGELFELPESNVKYSTALEVCAGGKLFNVVVDNEVTGSNLLDKEIGSKQG